MILCIDTTTEYAGVCVADGKRPVYLKLDARHASDKLMETIDQVIQKADVALSDLNGIMVIKGPGSFTGLRVGVAVANQFAHQLNIPIIGLRTEDWYRCRTDKKDFFYLQSMNRDQVYMIGFGKFKRDFPESVIPISECHYELASTPGVSWLGQLNDAHQKALADIEEIAGQRLPDETWLKVAQAISLPSRKTYELVEPFYGKTPTITKSKRKLNM